MSEAYLFVIGAIISTSVVGTVWRIGRIEAEALRQARGEPPRGRRREARRTDDAAVPTHVHGAESSA